MVSRSRISKDEQGVYTITCATCAKKAVSFGAPQKIRSVVDEAFVSVLGQDHYLYQGIMVSQNIPASCVDRVKEFLDAQNLRDLHVFMIKVCRFFEGIDAYCHLCDVVYCREHFDTEVRFDEGFYDCTIGTCPYGHQRKLDD